MKYFKIFFENQSSYISQLPQKSIFSVAFLVLAAIVLQTQHAWVPGFFHDGHLYAALGKNAALNGKWIVPSLSQINYPHFNHHPPLFFILEGLFFQLFGASWISARLFHVSFSIGILILLIRLIKYHSPHPTWWYWSAFAYVFMPPLFKKIRSPGLDFPLTFFIFSGLYFYYKVYDCQKEKKKFNWMLCGLFFGLSLLTKGPPALVLPFIIFIHLIFGKTLKELLSIWPWLGLILGIGLFSIWPLSLALTDQLSSFTGYFQHQFMATVINGRHKPDIDLLNYPYYLLENTGPFLPLAILGTFFWFKNKKRDRGKEQSAHAHLQLFFICILYGVFIPFSFMRWKYSHYLLPFYPGYAAIAGLALTHINLKWQRYLAYTVKGMMVLSTVVLLVFPLTTKTRRDREIIKIYQLGKQLQNPPTSWITINNSYPYHNLTNLTSWLGMGEVVNIPNKNEISQIIKDPQSIQRFHSSLHSPYALLIKQQDFNDWEKIHPKFWEEKWIKLAFLKKSNVILLVEKKVIGNYDENILLQI